MSWRTVRHLVYGALLGTVGVQVLKSEDAKKVYTYATAYAKRGVDAILGGVQEVLEQWQDISADADEINEKYFKEKDRKQVLEAKALVKESEEETFLEKE